MPDEGPNSQTNRLVLIIFSLARISTLASFLMVSVHTLAPSTF
jgi:hypothetical protein